MNRIAALLAASIATALAAQPIPENRGAAALKDALRKLESGVRILYVVAHPDDEDAGTLTLLSRGLGADVTLLSITRGESGANLITRDFFDRLGALRTLEHLKAAEYYGVRVRYTRFADFGYSKSVEETWRNWNKEEVLSDVVRMVREVRPHIIVSRWQGSPRDGHGHHHAAGVLAIEAWSAAADPARFPSHGLPPWKALKLYTGNWRRDEPGVLAVDSGVYDPLYGRSYAEIGREGYRFQRSQAMGAVLVRPGPSLAFYRLVESALPVSSPESSMLDGLPPALSMPAEVRDAIRAAASSFNAESPQSSAPALARALAAVRRARAAGDSFDLALLEQRAVRALSASLGVVFEALVEPDSPPPAAASLFRPASTFRVAAPGQIFRVAGTLHVRTGAPVEVLRIQPVLVPGWFSRDIGGGRFEIAVPRAARPTAAHWSRPSLREAAYSYAPGGEFGAPLPDPALLLRATLRFEGEEFTVEQIPETSQLDSIGLQIREPLAAGPQVAVSFQTEAGVMPLGAPSYPVEVLVRNVGAAERKGVLSLSVPEGWRTEPPNQPFSLLREGEQARLRFRLVPPGGVQPGSVRVAARLDGGPALGFERITYPGLGVLYLSPPPAHRVELTGVKVAAGLRAGYVMGSGDDVPETLRQLGVETVLLDPDAVASADLSRFDVILLGIRAYAAREDIRTHNARLLEYVRRGGVLVVQYNTQEFDHNYGPYPYSMTMRAEEVSEEDAPVTVLQPDAAVFNWPNRITPADWTGWFEQRGSKFWTTWDPRYTPLVESHDSGQPPQKGGWLEARYGQGLYVYCAYAWYRQLPQAVPGAVRLFANLVSLGARDAPWRKP
jgi:LmbE family N-acetylglucosaminyl deacetylase